MKYYLLISALITSAALADTWTVDDDGAADFDNIQSAVDASSDGDEIIVMPGTYTGSGEYVISMNGKAVLLRSEEGSEFTIISGENQRTVLYCGDNETTSTIISGFTITNGSGRITPMLIRGGGIFCHNSSPTIEYNAIIDNTAFSSGDEFLPAFCYGGGIYATNTSLFIRSNSIIYNLSQGWQPGFPGNFPAGSGGGIYIENGIEIQLNDNIIHNNSTINSGSGITCEYSSGVINRNSISYNQGAGGLFLYESDFIISENNILGNSHGGVGLSNMINTPLVTNNIIAFNEDNGGIGCGDSNAIIEFNTVMFNNGSTFSEYGIRVSGYPVPVILNNIISDNERGALSLNFCDSIPVVHHNDINGSILTYFSPENTIGDNTWGFNANGTACDEYFNISAPPLLGDPLQFDFTLQSNSSCIDAGNPESPLDPDCSLADMGAYFFDHCSGMNGGDVIADGMIDILDIVAMAGCILEYNENIDSCLCHDMNDDCILDILDIIILVDIIIGA